MSLISRTYLSPIQNRFFQATWDWLAEHTNLYIHRDLALASTHDPDVLFMCGLPTGQRIDRYEPLVAAVLSQERYGGRPIYFSDRRPGRDRGATGAFVEDCLQRQGVLLRLDCPALGLAALELKPASMTWVVTGSHLVSLEAVKKGTADAAGIDSMVLDLVTGEAAPAAGLVTIESFGPWPAPPISTSVDMDRSVREELASIFTSMHEDPGGAHLLATWGVERLAAVDAAEYSRLARFAETTASQ